MQITLRLTVRRLLLAILCCGSLSCARVSKADEPSAPAKVSPADAKLYQPAGAPADPKVAVQWNKYHDHAAATEILKQLAAAHPDRCRLESLGKSHGGREMWLFTLGALKDGKPELEKPAFWIDGAIHANEIQGTEVVLYTAWYLLESYGRSPLVTRLLDERMFYLVPMMSPDSRDAHMHEPNTTHSPRSGEQPVDDDGDGLVDEDRADDLDGDGSITQMRIRDPNGRWKSHPEYPELMIPALPEEKGEFTLLGREGLDNDGDGHVDEDERGEYDPNRNWPWDWQPDYIQNGAGNYPLWVREDRMVADFIAAHPNIAGAQSYHNTGGMILRVPGVKGEHIPATDEAVLTEIGKVGEAMLPGYRSIEVGKDLYEVYGGELDWLYQMQGVFCFTNELFTPFNFFRQKPEGGGWMGTPEAQRRFNKYLLLGDGVVAWHEFQHPQFGKIEIGGMKKNWSRQPPSFLLEEECHRNMAFTLYHADQMPRVAVDKVVTRPLEGGLTEVTATIVNTRLIPTRAAIDEKHKITPPDRVTIEGSDVRVVAGLKSADVVFRHSEDQKRHPRELWFDAVPGMGAVYARWIVSGAGPYTVTVRSAKGGIATGKSP